MLRHFGKMKKRRHCPFRARHPRSRWSWGSSHSRAGNRLWSAAQHRRPESFSAVSGRPGCILTKAASIWCSCSAVTVCTVGRRWLRRLPGMRDHPSAARLGTPIAAAAAVRGYGSIVASATAPTMENHQAQDYPRNRAERLGWEKTGCSCVFWRFLWWKWERFRGERPGRRQLL
ncbi:hypothetical protein FN846DRAFT_56752 [Sphaerosporella brunnea]|uniref:Uncharacterized protein n=1 Tax=Sphaerosporella brunnea TaxID=1250544 RepID=A0A5J5F9Q1_9PEZI|nr:hypothetical protein FN846DRAFT_56752 [Sphaerosporella brunnea]